MLTTLLTHDCSPYTIHMKAVQITFDEELLRRLSESDESREHGRSEVVRRAVREYLERQERLRIAEQYRKAYAHRDALEKELEGWSEESVWPES